MVDLNYRPFVSTDAERAARRSRPPSTSTSPTVDLSGFDWTLAERRVLDRQRPDDRHHRRDGRSSAGTSSTRRDPVQLDPLSVSFNAAMYAPALVELPRITVSKTTGLHVGDTIIVSRRRLRSDARQRHPAAAEPASRSGSYVTFGEFADVWKPSAGAPPHRPARATSSPSAGRCPSRPTPSPAPTSRTRRTCRSTQNGTFEAIVEISGLGTAHDRQLRHLRLPGLGCGQRHLRAGGAARRLGLIRPRSRHRRAGPDRFTEGSPSIDPDRRCRTTTHPTAPARGVLRVRAPSRRPAGSPAHGVRRSMIVPTGDPAPRAAA